MDYQSCLDFLSQYHAKKSPHIDGRHLQVMNDLFQLFQVDLQHFHIVQITGSCGKGSTAQFISSILQSARVSHGLFTGPHLIRYEERFAINGEFISPDEFAGIVGEIAEITASYDMADVGHKHLMTLIAMLWFARRNIRLVIFENGAGGKSDPSNVFNPIMACLTEITLDHTHLLGNTITEITKDKSAIIKSSAKYAVCGMYDIEAREFLYSLEKVSTTEFNFINRDYGIESVNNGLIFKSKKTELKIEELGLEGTHQHQNAANAVQVVLGLKKIGYPIEDEAIKHGLKKARFPGRLEILDVGESKVVLDGAHNPLELSVLTGNLKRMGISPELILISFASKKNVEEMLKALNIRDAYYIIAPSPFAARRQARSSVEDVFKRLNLAYQYSNDVKEAWEFVLQSQKKNILVTGSLYLVGGIREWLAGR